MKCLMINRLDGGVSLLMAETEELCLEHFEKWKTQQGDHEVAVSQRFIDYGEYESKCITHKEDFRNTWCDVTPDPTIDIDLSKAKDIQLDKLRRERQQAFVDIGFPYKLNDDVEKSVVSVETQAKLKSLRDATEPLKALVVQGYNDDTVLQQIKDLGTLPT